jgi:hypothetical protein
MFNQVEHEMQARIFLPAIVAAVTDVIASAAVRTHQGDLPVGFLIYQAVMMGLALLLAVPVRWVWLAAFLLLMGGMILAGFTVGFLYIPTVAVAGWVMVRRLENSGGDPPV